MTKEIVSSFKDGVLLGESFKSDSPESLLDNDYDIAFFVSSWEERCISFAQSEGWKTDSAVLLLFSDRDTNGVRDQHDILLRTAVEKNANTVTIFNDRSVDIDIVWNSIFDHILSLYNGKNRPLRILIDSSTCPRYYTLAIVGACLTEGITEKLSIVYAEGTYPSQIPNSHGNEEIKFTDGHWKAVAVPYFEGSYSPGKNRFYLISVGFEGWKTLRVVSRADPDRVSILFPEPGFQPEYALRTRNDNDDLIKAFCIPDDQIVSAAAGDAIGAWRSLTHSTLERKDTENSYFLCCGSKPHSLALGLRALMLGFPAVLYNLPEGHSAVPVVSNGVFWRYDISSASVPFTSSLEK